MYTITTARIHIPEFVDVYSIWDTRVDECKDTSIDKGLCSWFDIKFVTANDMYGQFGQNEIFESKHTLSRVASGHYRNSLQ